MDNMVTTHCIILYLVFFFVCSSYNYRFGFNAGSTESIEGTYCSMHMYIQYVYVYTR